MERTRYRWTRGGKRRLLLSPRGKRGRPAQDGAAQVAAPFLSSVSNWVLFTFVTKVIFRPTFSPFNCNTPATLTLTLKEPFHAPHPYPGDSDCPGRSVGCPGSCRQDGLPDQRPQLARPAPVYQLH